MIPKQIFTHCNCDICVKKLLKISSKLEHERKNLGGLKIQLGKIKKKF